MRVRTSHLIATIAAVSIACNKKKEGESKTDGETAETSILPASFRVLWVRYWSCNKPCKSHVVKKPLGITCAIEGWMLGCLA